MANARWFLPALLLIEIAETTFLPLPYEALFIAICAAARERIWIFIFVTVLGSAIAGAIMYGLGAGYGHQLAGWLGIEVTLTEVTKAFETRGGSFIFLGGTTPAPSYLINLAAGASGYPFWTFLALFTSSRFLRFLIIGAVIYFFGDEIAAFWKRVPKPARRTISAVLIVGLLYWFVSGFIG